MEGSAHAGSKVKDERSDDDDITVVEDENDAEKEAGALNGGASSNGKQHADQESEQRQSTDAFKYTMQGVLDDDMSPLESRQDSHGTNVDLDVSGFHASMDQGLDQGGWSWNKDSEIIHPDMSNPSKDIYFECEYCHKRLSCKSNLGRHIKEQHTTIKHAYSCLQCMAEFKRRCDLRIHYSKHHPHNVHEAESVTYQVSRFAGLEVNSQSDYSRGASYLGDQETSTEVQRDVFEMARHAPKDSDVSSPVSTSDVSPLFSYALTHTPEDSVTTQMFGQRTDARNSKTFIQQAPTHISQDSVGTRPLQVRAAASNSETDFLYQASRNQVSMERTAIQKMPNSAVLRISNAESLHGGSSCASLREFDDSGCVSLMNQMANEVSDSQGSSASGRQSLALAGRYTESRQRKNALPPSKRHCPDSVQIVASEKTDLQIVNVVGSAYIEGGKNLTDRKNHEGRRSSTGREIQVQSSDSRKKNSLSLDSSEILKLDDPAGTINKKEQGKCNTSQRNRDGITPEPCRGTCTSRLKCGTDASTSAQEQSRELTVNQQDDAHAMEIQKHCKRTRRNPYSVIVNKQRSRRIARTLSKSTRLANKKTKLYIKCKNFVAAYEKRMWDASAERCMLNKKVTAVENPLSARRANAAVCGIPPSYTSLTDQHHTVSQNLQTTQTRRAEQGVANQDIKQSNCWETCGTQTDLTLDNDQRKCKDTRNLHTNPRQPSVQKDTSNSSESASSSNTSLPVLLNYFGPRLTEYEECSTVEDFGAGGIVIRREVTERKYKMEPGEGRFNIKTEME